MVEKKEKRIRYTTPIGVWVWPKLDAPNTKFKKEGTYETKVRYTPEEAAPLHKMLQPLYEQALAQAKAEWEAQTPPQKKKNPFKENPYFEPEYDKEGNETGFELFKFAADASGETKAGKKWEFKPKLFNSAGQLLTNPPRIGNGSKGRVSFEVRPYFIPGSGAAGMKLTLAAAQVLELSQGSADPGAYGFSAEEGYDDVHNATSSADEGEVMEAKHSGPDF